MGMRISFRVMMRQLAVALLSACLVMLPLTAHALGFGNIRIKSALNEPLDAEIELLSATAADLKGLKIKLASHEAFLRAGIERPGHLSQLKFAIKRRSNGRAYLQLTTKQSVREPFLDFLLEMNWKNGRMLREYTVLLDPPDRLQQQPTIVESPETESPAIVAEQEQQDTSTPFVEPESAVLAEAEPEPAALEPLEPVADEPVVAESIAAADVEEEPIPLAESVPEQELQLAEEPVVAEEISIAQVDEQAATIAEPAMAIPDVEETVDEDYADPFAGEKFPRIPIKADKRLRQAVEAELAEIETDEPGEPVLEQTPLADESIQQEARAEESELAEEALAGEELAQQTEEFGAEAVDSVTTKRNDKLWNIAESMKPDESVSIYQVMMALQQSNPDAFVDGNVHRLKVGKVLRIEDPSILSAMSKSQAAQEYITQTQAWEDYRQQLAASRTPLQAEMAGDIDSPATEALPEDPVPAEQTSGELVLAAPEGDNQTAGSTGDQQATVNNEVVILREEIRQALSEAEAEGNKNVVLNEKLRDLESQLQDLQRSVTVQDDELATLQTQLSELNKKNVEAEQAEVMAPHSEIPAAASTPETTVTDTAAPEEPAQTDSAVMSEAELLAQSQEQVPAESAMPETAQAEQPPAVVEPEPATDTAPGMADKTFGVLDRIKQTMSGIVSSLPISPMILAISAGVIVVLLLLMLLLVQRRRQAANFQESILSGIPSHEIMASEEASLETNLSGESSFLSDFAISGASALQGDDGDVDPLTEADVFMAYGRYEAAEERILEAIKKDPDRQELRIKLLELYNTTKNKAAFESAAEEMFTNLGNDASNPLWQKVVVMGAILAPENPIFSDTVVGDDVTRIRNMPDTTVQDENILDLGFDDKPAVAEETAEQAVTDDLGLDLDFALDAESDEPSTALDFDLESNLADTPPAEESGGFDLKPDSDETAQVELADEFDLKIDTDETAEVESSGLDFEIPTDETAEVDSLNMDMDLSLEDTAQTEVALDMGAELPTDDTAQLGLDESLDLDIDMTGIENDATAMDLQLDDNDESSMGLTLDMDVSTPAEEQATDGLTMEMSQPTFNEMEMPTMEAEVDAADIAELDTPSMMDEVGTKLDLAKAYIDMGDPEGAKSILDEVLEEGTPPQQQEAQQLMQQI